MNLNLPDKIHADKKIIAFCDESSQSGHRYFVLGAVYFIPTKPDESDLIIQKIEKKLADIKTKYRLMHELKWEKIPTEGRYREGYKEFLRLFLENIGRIRFRCLVVDTVKYPLNHKVYMGGDALTGYVKFYCTFLCDGLMKNKGDHFFEIIIDRYSSDFNRGVEILEQTTNWRFMRKTNGVESYLEHCSISEGKAKDHNLLQLVDLLVGAISFVWNKKGTSKSKRGESKSEMIEFIQRLSKKDLSKPTGLSREGFNIWEFVSQKK